MSMFCRQCEQTAQGKGCTVRGVCGKDESTAIVQDCLIHILKGLAVYAQKAKEVGIEDKAVKKCIREGLFTTVTNVNFDPERIFQRIQNTYELKERIKQRFLDEYQRAHTHIFAESLPEAASWKPEVTLQQCIEQGRSIGILSNPGLNEDIRGLREVLLYGMKGMAAYADHAALLGAEDPLVDAFFIKGLSVLATTNQTTQELLQLLMELGKINLRCLELLDTAHTNHFGHPVPTYVFCGVKKGPAIVVSGHDLLDLEQLLQQTQNTGINVYTHGEMLPAHAYPQLQQYPHLAGHFGSAWQNQQKEFAAFPGAILFTTNCIQNPLDSYKDRVFTTGLVSWPGIAHINTHHGRKDFSTLIQKAIQLGGFKEEVQEKMITIGFAHKTVLSVADKVLEAVKSGAVRHIFLIGGCDGAKPGRNYYTEFAQQVPEDCLILTLACGKFRFNKLDFGAIGPFPRLLDCGQCNDAYSAIKIASALAEACHCSVNELPLSLVLSWYEQKAVCILLTLLSLGIKKIKLGPSLPACITPNVFRILVEQFQISSITTPKEDMRRCLNSEA